MRLMRMRVKRFLIFFLLLFVIASSYMYYTLFFTPHHDRSSLNSFVVHQEKAPVHEKQNESMDNDNQLDDSEVMKLHPQGIQKRLRDGKERDGEEREKETNEELDSPHEESRSKRLKNLMLKQQKIIEKQAQLLERLHKQAEDVKQGQELPRKAEHPQDHHPARPLESRKDVHREVHEDSGMDMARVHDQVDSGGHEDNQVMKLAVNGIQPRRKPNLGKYNRNNEQHMENQRPHEMFERVQLGRSNKHLPLAPPPEHGDDGDDEVGIAHELDGNNPRVMEAAGAQPMLNRARQKGQRNMEQHLPVIPHPLESQDDVKNALGMFQELVRKNQEVMAANRKRQRAEAIQNKIKNRQNVEGMDAQQMFHHFVRNNPLQEIGDENQPEVNNNPHPPRNVHRPRRSMGAGAGRRHIASYESGTSEDGASDTHNKASNVRLLREQRHKLEQQNKTRFYEAMKVLAQLGRVDKFRAEVKDLSVPVNGTVKCVPIRMRFLARPICVYSTQVDTRMSRYLVMTGTFHEEQELKEFHTALSTDDSLAAVDIGAALGVYSLLAAGKNRTVLAVEPLRDHQRLFTRTMQINKLTKQVTLVTNALGERKQFGRIRSPHPSGNMGTVYVNPITKWTQVGDDVNTIVRMLPLDDLLPVVKFRSAVMKLDVQGDEEMVLRGAHRFFDTIDVRYVLMHWLPAFTRDNLNECLLFFVKRGYIPTPSLTSNKTYSMQDLQKDINFIVWRKKGH